MRPAFPKNSLSLPLRPAPVRTFIPEKSAIIPDRSSRGPDVTLTLPPPDRVIRYPPTALRKGICDNRCSRSARNTKELYHRFFSTFGCSALRPLLFGIGDRLLSSPYNVILVIHFLRPSTPRLTFPHLSPPLLPWGLGLFTSGFTLDGRHNDFPPKLPFPPMQLAFDHLPLVRP